MIGPIDTPRINITSFPLSLNGLIGPISVPDITLVGPLTLSGTTGPIHIPIFNFGLAPGYFNATADPTSGFFNAGQGGGSGFFNTGGASSGFYNIAGDIGVSGIRNFGQLESGVLNLGNTISGIYNSSPLGEATAAFNSGILNIGSALSGVLYSGVGPAV